jgi:hypothetical protein
MNTTNANCREFRIDSDFLIEVSDHIAAAVVGGAAAGATATAYAFGNPSTALTNTKTTARQFASGGSISMGWGSAYASGNNPGASVSTFGSGNTAVLAYSTATVFSTSNNFTHRDVAISSGFVIAVDSPCSYP